MSVFDNASDVTVRGKAVRKLSIGTAAVWEKTSRYTNMLPLATDTDRVTIYEGVGFKRYTRLSSGGNTVTSQSSYPEMCTSGFIPAQPGDILRVQGFSAISGNIQWYVIAYDPSNTVSGYKSMSAYQGIAESTWVSPGYFELVLDTATFGSTFDAIRFSAKNLTEESIATINQELS